MVNAEPLLFEGVYLNILIDIFARSDGATVVDIKHSLAGEIILDNSLPFFNKEHIRFLDAYLKGFGPFKKSIYWANGSEDLDLFGKWLEKQWDFSIE